MVVSDACQIKDLDHERFHPESEERVSDACQIKDLDHPFRHRRISKVVSDACQIKDLDHYVIDGRLKDERFRCLSDQRLRPLI